MKHVVFFSGGAVSYMTAKRVVEAHGAENVILLFSDTKQEDPTLYDFINASAEKLGCDLVVLQDGRDIWDVAEGDNFMFNSRVANCTTKLKVATSRKYIKTNFKPDECVLYLGIDWTESHRLAAPRKNWAPYQVEYPMAEQEPLLMKDQIFETIKQDGLELPLLYELNFAHNNCFHGDEKFITNEGLKTFKEAVNTDVKVLGSGGKFSVAKIKSFGEQEIVELTLVRLGKTKTIKTTLNHRWFVRKNGSLDFNEVLTSGLQKGDFLRSMHTDENTYPEWMVVGFKKTGVATEVFCAVVPDGHAFTLEDNILTGNCGGFCFKAGIGHFIHLLKTLPDRYFYHAERERLLSERLFKERGEVFTILRRTIKGVKTTLSLYELADLVIKENSDTMGKLYESYTKRLAKVELPPITNEEKFEFGGCGCFSTDGDVPDVEVNNSKFEVLCEIPKIKK